MIETRKQPRFLILAARGLIVAALYVLLLATRIFQPGYGR